MKHSTTRPNFEDRCPVCVGVLLLVGFFALVGLFEIIGTLLHG